MTTYTPAEWAASALVHGSHDALVRNLLQGGHSAAELVYISVGNLARCGTSSRSEIHATQHHGCSRYLYEHCPLPGEA